MSPFGGGLQNTVAGVVHSRAPPPVFMCRSRVGDGWRLWRASCSSFPAQLAFSVVVKLRSGGGRKILRPYNDVASPRRLSVLVSLWVAVWKVGKSGVQEDDVPCKFCEL